MIIMLISMMALSKIGQIVPLFLRCGCEWHLLTAMLSVIMMSFVMQSEIITVSEN
jgi:hypothetical protein